MPPRVNEVIYVFFLFHVKHVPFRAAPVRVDVVIIRDDQSGHARDHLYELLQDAVVVLLLFVTCNKLLF